jgi:hypothetical protein
LQDGAAQRFVPMFDSRTTVTLTTRESGIDRLPLMEVGRAAAKPGMSSNASEAQ